MERDPYYFQILINPVLSLVGSVLCVTSFIIFNNPIFKESFFYHVKVECAFMSINLLLVVLHPIYYWDYSTPGSNVQYKPYFAYFIFKWPINYGKSICETIVLFSNIISGIRCFLFITTNKFRPAPALCRRHPGTSSTLMITLIACALYSYIIIKFDIEEIEENNKNWTNYSRRWQLSELDLPFLNYFQMFVMTLRDGLGLFLLVSMNLLLLYKVRKRLGNKIRLLRCHILKSINKKRVDCEQCESSNNEIIIHRPRIVSTVISDSQKIEKAKSRLTITIYLSTLKCLIGRLPIFVYFIFKSCKSFSLSSTELESKIFAGASFCIYLSYSSSFFLFYYCNTKFRKVSKQYFISFRTKLRLIYLRNL